MELLTILFGVFLAAGLFLIASDRLKLPKLATEKAMLTAVRRDRKKADSLEVYLHAWAEKLAKYIRMDEYKKGF